MFSCTQARLVSTNGTTERFRYHLHPFPWDLEVTELVKIQTLMIDWASFSPLRQPVSAACSTHRSRWPSWHRLRGPTRRPWRGSSAGLPSGTAAPRGGGGWDPPPPLPLHYLKDLTDVMLCDSSQKLYKLFFGGSVFCWGLISPLWKPELFFWTRSLGLNPKERTTVVITDTADQALSVIEVRLPVWQQGRLAALPVTRGRVALFGLGLSGGLCAICVAARFLLPLDRLSGGFLPVSGSLWINFFSTYFDRIHDSLSPLRIRKYQKMRKNKRERWRIRFSYIEVELKQKKATCRAVSISVFLAFLKLSFTSLLEGVRQEFKFFNLSFWVTELSNAFI